MVTAVVEVVVHAPQGPQPRWVEAVAHDRTKEVEGAVKSHAGPSPHRPLKRGSVALLDDSGSKVL